IRAIGYSAAADKLAGMTPVAISQSEVYEALQRGVVDGTSGSSFDILIDRDYQEVAPHFVDPRTGNYAVTLTVINKDVWESMPDDIKDAINTVSEAYLDMYLGKLEERESQACDELIEAGGDIVFIDDSEVEEWANNAKDDVRELWLENARKSNADIDPEAF